MSPLAYYHRHLLITCLSAARSFLLYPGLCLRWVKLCTWTPLAVQGEQRFVLTEVRGDLGMHRKESVELV